MIRGMVHPGLLPRKDLREPQGALQIPPLRFASVGITRGEGWLRLEWLRDGEKPQVPPLRYAPVGMTRGEGWLRLEWLRDGEKPQVPPLRYPGFPVELGGFGKRHAPLFTERRTRGSL